MFNVEGCRFEAAGNLGPKTPCRPPILVEPNTRTCADAFAG